MLPRTLFVLVLIATICGALNNSLAKPKLGILQSEIFTQVTVDQLGNPVIGGRHKVLIDDRKPEACLLQVKFSDGEKLIYRYLVYPLGGSNPAAQLKDQFDTNDPDFGYHWRKVDHTREDFINGGTAFSTSSFYPASGDWRKHWLSSDANKQLILRDNTTQGENGGHVGVIRGYDNLNDGK